MKLGLLVVLNIGVGWILGILVMMIFISTTLVILATLLGIKFKPVEEGE